MNGHPVFEYAIDVAEADIDALGHVNNVVYLRYVQDAAAAHWFAVTSEEQRENHLWVVRRHEIEYLKPAVSGDRLLVRTWIGEFKGATCEHLTEIRRPKDEQTLVTARSLWILLDPVRRRPRRADDSLQVLFGMAARVQKGDTLTATLDTLRPRNVEGAP